MSYLRCAAGVLVFFPLVSGCGGDRDRSTEADAAASDTAGGSDGSDAAADGGLEPGCTPGGFAIEDVAEDGIAPSLAVGPDGVMHAAYTVRLSGVFYARRAADGSWTSEPLDEGFADAFSGIAVAPDGTVGVAWGARQNATLEYAWRTGTGEWTHETIDPAGSDLGLGPRVAFGEDGRAHVVWVRDGVRYAVRDGVGTWTTAIVSEDPGVSGRPTIRADANGIEVCYGVLTRVEC
ncbi:MAG: hypothetical protein KDA28_07180, partial [Phycisphaerales bacterium]|nr:hypothetical protein [Phycisphaerales bacterium]